MATLQRTLMAVTLAAAALVLGGCLSSPPERQENVCDIFKEKKNWYRAARRSSRRWGTPIPALMAIAKQESSFRARARPPRKKILWIIPGPRPASAYGFAQATNEAWKQYQKATGRWGADRNDFGDAMDFIGWYNNRSHKDNGIAKSDTYNLYLAYHEGHAGWRRRTYRNKAWLIDVARKVERRAGSYGTQLKRCEKRLRRGRFFGLF